jgi:ribosomal protein S18 acetylase RimI-like enzyme
MNTPLEVRPLTPEDVELICRHREDMFLESGRDSSIVESMTAPFREWLRPRLTDGSYFGYVLMEQDSPIAGIGLMAIDWPPHPSHPLQDKRGYVLNVYVEKSHRRRGLARQLMALAEETFRERGLQFAILHSTNMGRPLYDGLGWSSTTEMSKALHQ